MKIKSLGKAIAIAKQIFKNKDKIKDVYKQASDTASDNKEKMGSGLWSDVKTLKAMLNAIIKRTYKFPKKTAIYVIAGLLYFISPIDLVPDFFIGLGFLDDAAVLAFVVKKLKKEIDKFKTENTYEEFEVVQ